MSADLCGPCVHETSRVDMSRGFTRRELALSKHASPISPSSLPEYKKRDLRSQYDSFSIKEKLAMNGISSNVVLKSFKDLGDAAGAQGELRVLLMCLAAQLDKDSEKKPDVWHVENEKTDMAIIMRILKIVEGDGGVPLIFVKYITIRKNERNMARTFRAFMDEEGQEMKLWQDQGSSQGMLDMLALLLELNSEALDDDDAWVKKQRKETTKKDFHFSFICPIGIPEEKGVVALCVCGKEGKSICSKCRKQFYCGKECQKSDWKQHKLVCAVPSGNDYVDVDATKPHPPGMDGLYLSCLNSNKPLTEVCNTTKDIQEVSASSTAPGIPTKREEQTVVVKVQVPTGDIGNLTQAHPLSASMLCYDQKKKFTLYIGLHNTSEEGYRKLFHFVRSKGLLGGLKAYLNAIVTNDGKTLRILTNNVVEGATW